MGFVSTLVLSSSYVFVIGPLTGHGSDFGGNSHDGYLELAGQIVSGHGFVFEENGPPNLHRPPFYPLLIVPVSLLDANWQRLSLILIHSLIVGGTCYFLFHLGTLLFGRVSGGLAVMVLLLSPWTYLNAKNPMPPVTQAFLYTAFVYFLAQYWTSRPSKRLRWAQAMGLGVLAAALTLTHGAMLPVMIVFFGATYYIGIASGRVSAIVS